MALMHNAMLTTFDNPYDPFEQFSLWFLFDMQKGYNSCAYLGRIAKVSDQFSQEENEREVELAIDEIVKKRPLRYETFISPDENNLSGGEIQRIILARALLNSFNILLLDEALSEVDMKLELSILKNMRKLYKDKTIIYISHKKYPKIFDNVINLG